MNPTTMQNAPAIQFNEILLPDPVSWWPIAWPWWLISATALLTLTFLVHFYLRNKWRKHAINKVNQMVMSDDVAFAQACNRLLKQVAISKLGKTCSNYHGIQWLEYLDAQVKHPIFLPKLEQFSKWVDQPNANVDRLALAEACKKWIRKVQC